MGRKVKLSLRKRVKLEIKGDKTENRVLVSQFLLLLKSFIITCKTFNVVKCHNAFHKIYTVVLF